jgi:(S)-2-hydroxyglutarate dehydrogenase
MTDERVDVAIIGGGIVGLATAHQLLRRRPDLRLAIVEKETELARHQSGHNSGVLHAGLYYAPGSLKAILCREGKAEVERFADEHGIAVRHPGKLVVALSESELPRLDALRERAEANGVEGLEAVGPERIRELEPRAAGIRGLWSPRTGIVDFRAVALAIADEVRGQGGRIDTGRPVTGLRELPDGVVLSTGRGELRADRVIACAGLQADRVAAMSGGGSDVPRIVPFRGDYYTLKPEARGLVSRLIYPVPDPRFPFLGVHFTPRIDGEVWAGPNAVLAFAREGYRRLDLDLRDLVGTLTYRGFLRLAGRHLRMGLAEMWRDWSKRAFVAELQRYLPDLRSDQLTFGPSGVRAQALGTDGTLIDDFSLGGSQRILHVHNAPSPAATASLAIGRVLAERAIERFELA